MSARTFVVQRAFRTSDCWVVTYQDGRACKSARTQLELQPGDRITIDGNQARRAER